jgi:hypothetical protein
MQARRHRGLLSTLFKLRMCLVICLRFITNVLLNRHSSTRDRALIECGELKAHFQRIYSYEQTWTGIDVCVNDSLNYIPPLK